MSINSFASHEQLVFSQAPRDFKPNLEAAACFLKAGDEFLFLHRNPDTTEGGKWGIPGGKLEKGESSSCGVIREVLEETGFQIDESQLKHLGTVYIRQQVPAKDFIYDMFEYRLKEKFEVKINAETHKGFSWMTLGESLNYNLIQGEDECIDRAYGVRRAH